MITVALKEWLVVCNLLFEGKMTLLLRKGGIHEDAGPGKFTLSHYKFALFPTWEHQRGFRLKSEYRGRVAAPEGVSDHVRIEGFAQVDSGCVWRVRRREAMGALDDLHCWTPDQINKRFHYKPDQPLYLIAVRAYRLACPKTLEHDVAYTGCRSWVELRAEDQIDESGATAVLEEDIFDAVVKRIRIACERS